MFSQFAIWEDNPSQFIVDTVGLEVVQFFFAIWKDNPSKFICYLGRKLRTAGGFREVIANHI